MHANLNFLTKQSALHSILWKINLSKLKCMETNSNNINDILPEELLLAILEYVLKKDEKNLSSLLRVCRYWYFLLKDSHVKNWIETKNNLLKNRDRLNTHYFEPLKKSLENIFQMIEREPVSQQLLFCEVFLRQEKGYLQLFKGNKNFIEAAQQFKVILKTYKINKFIQQSFNASSAEAVENIIFRNYLKLFLTKKSMKLKFEKMQQDTVFLDDEPPEVKELNYEKQAVEQAILKIQQGQNYIDKEESVNKGMAFWGTVCLFFLVSIMFIGAGIYFSKQLKKEWVFELTGSVGFIIGGSLVALIMRYCKQMLTNEFNHVTENSHVFFNSGITQNNYGTVDQGDIENQLTVNPPTLT